MSNRIVRLGRVTVVLAALVVVTCKNSSAPAIDATTPPVVLKPLLDVTDRMKATRFAKHIGKNWSELGLPEEPRNARDILISATHWRQTLDYRKLLKHLLPAVAQDPNSMELHLALGETYYELGLLDLVLRKKLTFRKDGAPTFRPDTTSREIFRLALTELERGMAGSRTLAVKGKTPDGGDTSLEFDMSSPPVVEDTIKKIKIYMSGSDDVLIPVMDTIKLTGWLGMMYDDAETLPGGGTLRDVERFRAHLEDMLEAFRDLPREIERDAGGTPASITGWLRRIWRGNQDILKLRDGAEDLRRAASLAWNIQGFQIACIFADAPKISQLARSTQAELSTRIIADAETLHLPLTQEDREALSCHGDEETRFKQVGNFTKRLPQRVGATREDGFLVEHVLGFTLHRLSVVVVRANVLTTKSTEFIEDDLGWLERYALYEGLSGGQSLRVLESAVARLDAGTSAGPERLNDTMGEFADWCEDHLRAITNPKQDEHRLVVRILRDLERLSSMPNGAPPPVISASEEQTLSVRLVKAPHELATLIHRATLTKMRSMLMGGGGYVQALGDCDLAARTSGASTAHACIGTIYYEAALFDLAVRRRFERETGRVNVGSMAVPKHRLLPDGQSKTLLETALVELEASQKVKSDVDEEYQPEWLTPKTVAGRIESIRLLLGKLFPEIADPEYQHAFPLFLLKFHSGDPKAAYGLQFERLRKDGMPDMPEEVSSWISKGVRAEKAGELANAVRYYNRALAIEPNSYVANFDKANALSTWSRCREAVAAYDRALGVRPSAVEVLLNREKARLQARGIPWPGFLNAQETLSKDLTGRNRADRLGAALLMIWECNEEQTRAACSIVENQIFAGPIGKELAALDFLFGGRPGP